MTNNRITKAEFLLFAKQEFKRRGFRKRGNYWFEFVQEWVFCITVQGSQWDSDDYYVNIGAMKKIRIDPFPQNCIGNGGTDASFRVMKRI